MISGPKTSMNLLGYVCAETYTYSRENSTLGKVTNEMLFLQDSKP